MPKALEAPVKWRFTKHMKVAILTDPPKTLRLLPRQQPQLAGNYTGILRLQRRLEQSGHNVETYVALPGKRISSEAKLREALVSHGRIDSNLPGADESVSFQLILRVVDCVVVALKKESLMDHLPSVLQASRDTARPPDVYVSVGPVTGHAIKELAAKSNTEVVILKRPGVARLTREATERILQSLEKRPAELA